MPRVNAEFNIEASRSAPASLEITYGPLAGAAFPAVRQSVQLVPGLNRISVPIHIANPKLWYPNGYGAQDRYQFSAVVRTGKRHCGECGAENRVCGRLNCGGK